MREVEQVRVEQRADDVLDHHHEPDTCHWPHADEQADMGDPHCDEHGGANEPELDGNREYLIVRIMRSLRDWAV